jgi:hypothetical protein
LGQLCEFGEEFSHVRAFARFEFDAD